ncbi:hypothetical protein BH09SUM1_BH09SUM1_16500 [soil metagenome]
MAAHPLLNRELAPRIRTLLFATLISAVAAAAPAQWTSKGTLAIPNYGYNFLSCTPSGDLLAASYNVNPVTGNKVLLPALLIKNPQSSEPKVVELCRAEFDPQRGYGGIAADMNGSFFVSGDTGNPQTSFIRKFQADGSPDVAFGAAGEVKPNHRCLGMDTVGKQLLVAMDWGLVQVYDCQSGALVGSLPPAPKAPYIRDITIDPRSMRVFGVAQGGVLMWGHGAPWSPAGYQFEMFSPPAGEPKSGEGISMDASRRCLLVIPHPGKTLLEIYGDRHVVKSEIATAGADSHLGDTAVSFDGTTVYISDMIMRKIHVMTRPATDPFNTNNNTVLAQSAPLPNTPSGPMAMAANWRMSYTEVVQEARQANKPMIVYFRKPGAKPSEDFELNVLKSNAFNQHAANFVCVSEDASKNRLLAYRFGVLRVPHVVVMDPNGDAKSEFSFNIEPEKLFSAMDKVGG